MNTETCDYLIFDAPFPPSLNALFEPHRIGVRCSVGKSAKYKNYQKKVFYPWWLSVRSKGKIDLGENIILWMILCPPRKGCDVDNYSKCLGDCLQHNEKLNHIGAFADDNQIVSHRIERGPRISGGLLRVFLANERHRDLLCHDYEHERQNDYHSRRDGPILKQPSNLRIRRVALTAS